jgi:SAM-dependent methyltransferase
MIKDGYTHRSSYTHYSDIGYEDQYQDEVYQTALKILKDNNLKTVYDVGCGSAYKLRKYFKNYNFTGAEIDPTLSWLKNRFPEDKWIESDFSAPVETELFICSDVIEHLVDPDNLLDFFDRSKFKYIVLSTPERDAVQIYQKGCLWNGPPLNVAHVREWNFKEFKNYISSRFEVLEHFMSQNKAETSPLCQIMVLKR